MTSPDLTSNSSNPDLPEGYQIGSVPFLGSTIYLDSRPLIPRTETEWWVEKCIASIPSDRSVSALELFAGSGAAGVSILKHHPLATVDFVDIEERHLPTIQKNILMNGIDPARAKVFKSDVWNSVDKKYDLVVANPPYLSRARAGRIQPSVLLYEPSEALFAEEDGFELIRRTLEGAPDHLNHNGALWLEHEPEHAGGIEQLAAAEGLAVRTEKDQYGQVRYSVILIP